jgi:hypothetical protein
MEFCFPVKAVGGNAPMKRVCAILPFLMLASCEDSDVYKVGTVLVNSVTGEPAKIPREQAAAIPYATMGLELGSTPELLLVLGTNTAGELDWYAGDQVFVRTRNGRITRTVGLPYDLGGSRTVARNATATNAASQYSLDFPDLGVFGAAEQCSSRQAGEETINVLGAPIPARHVVEHCTVADMRWNFDDDFWLDNGSGYIWRSRQYIHPNSPPVILEVFRPEQNPA